MNFDTVNSLVGTMGGMKYFPSAPAARLALVELMGELTDNEDQVLWLVHEVRTRFPEWPGEFAVRGVFCSRYRPKDGIVQSPCACGCGTVHAFRLAPAQLWPPQLAASTETKLLPPPEEKSEPSRDERLENAIHIAAKTVELKSLNFSALATEEEIRTAPEWLRRLEGYES